MAARFKVINWSAREGPDSQGNWVSRSAPTAFAEGGGRALSPRLRRRLTRLGAMALGAALAIEYRDDARFVFCSRHGDFQRTAALLTALFRREALSPTDFSMSVHNALAGMLSIARQAKAGHTAIAAGPNTFAYGLVEAAAILAADGEASVLLVYYDEPLPAPFDEIEAGKPEATVALALLLTPADDGVGVEALIGPAAARATGSSRAALDFIRFLESGAAEQACGDGSLHVRRLHAAA